MRVATALLSFVTAYIVDDDHWGPPELSRDSNEPGSLKRAERAILRVASEAKAQAGDIAEDHTSGLRGSC